MNRIVHNLDVRMEVKFADSFGASLFIDLLTTNKEYVVSNLHGNIMGETNVVVQKSFPISLVANPSAAIIRLRRGTGEIRVGEMLLGPDQDQDGLDVGQEALLGTSDFEGDSDQDGTLDKAEVDAGTNPTNNLSFLAGISGTVSYSGAQSGTVLIAVNTRANLWPLERSTTLSAPGAYSVTNLPNLTNYWITAFVDWNNSGSNECWEAIGIYSGNPLRLTDNAAAIDITLSDPPDADTDSLPDCWEDFYFQSLSNTATDDNDGDGLNNYGELISGNDPTRIDTDGDGRYDGDGYIRIQFTSIRVVTNGMRLVISYPHGFTNRVDIFTCTNLITANWTNVLTTNANLSTNYIEWIDAAASERVKFYVAANADVDSDSDGLGDGWEKFVYRTSPTNADTDGDGVGDGSELFTYQTDPVNIHNSLLPYSTGFESANGYGVGTLAGQNGWESDPGATVQAGIVHNGGQAVELEAFEATMTKHFATTNNSVTTSIFVHLGPQFSVPTNLPVTASSLVSYEAGSGIRAFDGNGLGGGSWFTASGTTNLLNQWVELKIVQNYFTQTWNLYVDDALKLSGLGFKDNSVTRLEGMHVRSGIGGATFCDDVVVSSN